MTKKHQDVTELETQWNAENDLDDFKAYWEKLFESVSKNINALYEDKTIFEARGYDLPEKLKANIKILTNVHEYMKCIPQQFSLQQGTFSAHDAANQFLIRCCSRDTCYRADGKKVWEHYKKFCEMNNYPRLLKYELFEWIGRHYEVLFDELVVIVRD